MGKINTLRAGYLKIQTNGKPLAKLIRKKRKEREKELKDTKLDMKLEEVNSWYHQNINSNNSLLQIITQYLARK